MHCSTLCNCKGETVREGGMVQPTNTTQEATTYAINRRPTALGVWFNSKCGYNPSITAGLPCYVSPASALETAGPRSYKRHSSGLDITATAVHVSGTTIEARLAANVPGIFHRHHIVAIGAILAHFRTSFQPFWRAFSRYCCVPVTIVPRGNRGATAYIA